MSYPPADPIKRLRNVLIVAFLFVNCVARQAAALDQPVLLRYGDHPGFGRVVLDIDANESVSIEQIDNLVNIHLQSKIKMPSGRPPRNVIKIFENSDYLTMEIVKGSRLRRSIINKHLVIDILDQQKDAANQVGARPLLPSTKILPHSLTNPVEGVARAARMARSMPAEISNNDTLKPNQNSAELAKVENSIEVSSNSVVVSSGPPGDAIPPVSNALANPSVTASSIAAVPDNVPEFGPGHMLLLPFGPNAGAAAFRRGDDVIVVFDERRPIDLQALKSDSVFGTSSVQLLPSATVMTVKLAAPAEVRLDRTKKAWSITAIGGDAVGSALRPISMQQKAGKALLMADQPGLVVSIPDPATGGILYVGVQRTPGQSVAMARRTPGFVLLPTWQGVVIEALSDGLSLRPVPSGFAAGSEAVDSDLSLSQPEPAAMTLADASQMSRIFDFPNLRIDRLLRRMQGAIVTAAAVPAPARTAARQEVAESMMALGLAAEAQSVLALSPAATARADQTPAMLALAAAAGILSGRLADADGMDDPRLDGNDEIALWRAFKTALRLPGNAAAAEVFANTAPLLLSYPPSLLRRLLPLATETMVLGGQADAAQEILQAHGEDASLDLARAYLKQGKGGDPAEAIALFQALASSPDRLIRVRAARAAAELEFATGRADAAKTAQALRRLLYAWRGDDREIDLRLRVAELQAQASEWRPALQVLRETAQLWPERSEQLKARMMATFAASISPTAGSAFKPFDLVAIAAENADLMPDGDLGLRLAERVAGALTQLDLPGRSMPYFEKMIQATPKGSARATFGARLAQIRLEQGNASGAVEALKSTATDVMPPELLETRTLVFAASLARLGDTASAVNALTQLDTKAGDLRLAELAEQSERWPDAVSAMRRVVAREAANGEKQSQDQVANMLRLATAATEAGDASILGQLRDRDLSTLPSGKASDLLRLILSRPVGAVADLPRASSEMIAARAIASAAP